MISMAIDTPIEVMLAIWALSPPVMTASVSEAPSASLGVALAVSFASASRV
jgi:hypothetical protein